MTPFITQSHMGYNDEEGDNAWYWVRHYHTDAEYFCETSAYLPGENKENNASVRRDIRRRSSALTCAPLHTNPPSTTVCLSAGLKLFN
jgi:hypothetical protein